MALDKVVASPHEAVADIRDGSSLAVGGFGLCEVSQMSDAFGDAPADRPLWGYSEPLLRHLATARAAGVGP